MSLQPPSILSFIGPGYMIAVGYMDPGNWATDLDAGTRYGYGLLWVILGASAMAMLLQHLCVRLGIYGRVDLAEASRIFLPGWTRIPQYLIAELAIISCDLAEVIGTAIALKLLFGIPLAGGVALTVADVLLLLGGGTGESRILEFIVIALMSAITLSFVLELFIVRPDWNQIIIGMLPLNRQSSIDRGFLRAALGILGATVMPHNLYLHSALVKRLAGPQPLHPPPQAIPPPSDSEFLKATESNEVSVWEPSLPKRAVRYATYDMIVALTIAFFVNASIMIVAAAAFHNRAPEGKVGSLEDAARLLANVMGPFAGILFGLALLAAGQSSTVAGTLAGQIVFEGFLKLQIEPWKRRLITRAVAILPTILIVGLAGEGAADRLLLYSQVVLSMQLPFAILPLVYFSFSKRVVLLPDDINPRKELALKVVSWLVAAIITALNLTFIATFFV